MTGKTHLNSGIFASIILCPDISSGLLLTFGSILPDVDHANSFLGKNFPLLSKIFKHRGFTHSFLFCILIGICNKWIAYGVLVHILFDLMTKNGAKLLYPLKFNIRFPLAKYVKTNGKFERILFVFLTSGIIYMLIYRFV